MAVKILSLVFEYFPEGGSELLAMLALADWSDDLGLCYPSMAAIAKKVRLSRCQAQRVVKGLTKSGWLAVEANQFGGAPGATGVSEFLCVRRKETFPRWRLPKVPSDRRRTARWESRWSF